MNQNQDSLDLVELIRILIKYYKVIIIFAIFCCSISFIYFFNKDRIYENVLVVKPLSISNYSPISRLNFQLSQTFQNYMLTTIPIEEKESYNIKSFDFKVLGFS